MIDPFVLLAPILLLLVVALLQFIGCSFSGGVAASTAGPTFDPPQGTYGSTLSVTLSCETPGATIYYTTGNQGPTIPPTGEPPTAPTQPYGGPIQVSTTTTIRAKAWAPGFSHSAEAVAQYNIIPLAEVPGHRAKGQVDDGVSATAIFPNAVTADDLLVVAGVVWRDNGGTTIIGIQDSVNTDYTRSEFVSTSDPNFRLFIAFGLARASGPNSVTVATAAASYTSFGIDEFTGIDFNMPVDTDGGGLSGGPNTTPMASITIGPNALIVGTVTFEPLVTATITPGTGYTEIAEEEDNGAHTAFNAEFTVVTTAGAQTVNWTLGTSLPWSLYRMSFRGWPIA